MQNAFDKIQHPFMTLKKSKPLNKLRIENFLNTVKNIYKKPTGDTIFHSKKLEAFLQRLRTRLRCPHSQLLFNVILKILAYEIRQEKELKIILIGKNKIKLSLFRDNMIVYVENLTDSPYNS